MLSGKHDRGFTVIENVLSLICTPAAQLSVALTVNVDVPVAFGIPLINPDELILIPDGNEPEIML
jgi:hypothetical protein